MTCNNNNTCENGESCNCADCNDVADHCAIKNGQQLVCSKDTVEQCFTDRFPYCFPACLNGYIRNASGQCVPGAVTAPPADKWLAYTYPGYASSYIYLTKLPVTANTVAGKTFYVYNPERIITGMTEAAFRADPSTAIKNATVLPIGNTRDITRLLFNMAQLQSEPVATQTAMIDSITSFIPHRYLCTENTINATNCSNNSNMGWTPNFGTVADGDIYVSKSNSGSGITFAQGQKLGTFEVQPTPSGICTNRSVNGTNTAIATCQSDEVRTGG